MKKPFTKYLAEFTAIAFAQSLAASSCNRYQTGSYHAWYIVGHYFSRISSLDSHKKNKIKNRPLRFVGAVHSLIKNITINPI